MVCRLVCGEKFIAVALRSMLGDISDVALLVEAIRLHMSILFWLRGKHCLCLLGHDSCGAVDVHGT